MAIPTDLKRYGGTTGKPTTCWRPPGVISGTEAMDLARKSGDMDAATTRDGDPAGDAGRNRQEGSGYCRATWTVAHQHRDGKEAMMVQRAPVRRMPCR